MGAEPRRVQVARGWVGLLRHDHGPRWARHHPERSRDLVRLLGLIVSPARCGGPLGGVVGRRGGTGSVVRLGETLDELLKDLIYVDDSLAEQRRHVPGHLFDNAVETFLSPDIENLGGKVHPSTALSLRQKLIHGAPPQVAGGAAHLKRYARLNDLAIAAGWLGLHNIYKVTGPLCRKPVCI